jgi:hypothetical protein
MAPPLTYDDCEFVAAVELASMARKLRRAASVDRKIFMPPILARGLEDAADRCMRRAKRLRKKIGK